MSLRRLSILAVTCLTAQVLLPVAASDHADPMSLNVFEVQKSPEANITDLHAFKDGENLVVSLCVRRALQPGQIAALDLEGYRFRVSMDLHPAVRTRLREVRPGEQPPPPSVLNLERSMLALYGGIIEHPEDITPEVTMEFGLDLVPDGERSEARLTHVSIQGLPGPVNTVSEEKKVNGDVKIPARPLQAGQINVQAGVFDDPFIFPRFFRRNVVGMVTSIPLKFLPVPDGPLLLWATTYDKDGTQIDHVGRSLRTQLPRFGYLNVQPPSKHNRAITRVHSEPALAEDLARTLVAPLFAHRHYDTVPDVMVYDLSRPASFPNGRKLTDDVAKILADAGETLLFELSYAESRQFPRATANDKPFRAEFPYLAPRWTSEDIKKAAAAGSNTVPVKNADGSAGTVVVDAADGAAITAPDLTPASWSRLWRILFVALIIILVLLWFTLRSGVCRAAVVLVAIVTAWHLRRLIEEKDASNMAQASQRLDGLIFSSVAVTVLFLVLVYAFGRRRGLKAAQVPAVPAGEQGITKEDNEYAGSRFAEVWKAVSEKPYYAVWRGPGDKSIPQYKLLFRTVASGLFSFWKPLPFRQAQLRTLKSRADLRWGDDGKGVRRLLHPNGICLAGEWIIDDVPGGTGYSGYFKAGSRGLVIARYSTCCSATRSGQTRSLSMVGKIYPSFDQQHPDPLQPASFITQEDLGGDYSASIDDAELRNAPDATPLRRGAGLPAFLLTIATFLKSDKEPGIRQLYGISELGKPDSEETVTPEFMRLTVDGGKPGKAMKGLDFRDEILSRIYDPGDPDPKRELVFNIEVAKLGTRRGKLRQQWKIEGWQRIGRIVFKQAAVSYNGDFVIHFHHPPWRNKVNDPASIDRPGLRR